MNSTEPNEIGVNGFGGVRVGVSEGVADSRHNIVVKKIGITEVGRDKWRDCAANNSQSVTDDHCVVISPLFVCSDASLKVNVL